MKKSILRNFEDKVGYSDDCMVRISIEGKNARPLIVYLIATPFERIINLVKMHICKHFGHKWVEDRGDAENGISYFHCTRCGDTSHGNW